MPDSEVAGVPKTTIDEQVPETATPDLAQEIAALEAERAKVLPKTSFNLRRGLEGGIPTGTFFMLGGVAFLVLNLLRHGLVLSYVLGALALFGIGLLLYVLSCWSRWRKAESKRQSLLAVLDQQIERKRNELQRQGKTPAS
jgi:hypothetical protein